MLDDAVDAFLRSVSERAFDQSLLAIIRAQGFSEVHFVHGQGEFGKDVIARRDGEQWAWQSKAGDIGQPAWRALVGQLDELRTVNLGHGSFDVGLRRRPVLVITGRLVGNAPQLYRDYNDRAKARGEPELELWDRDALLGMLSGNPDAILRGSMDGQLLTAVGAVDHGGMSLSETEVFSRRWMTWEQSRLTGLGIIEAGLLCESLERVRRLDMACQTALCLVRGGLAAAGAAPQAENAAAEAAGALFEVYARRLWASCDEQLLDGGTLVNLCGVSAWITYPVTCVRLAEILGLLSLRARESSPELSTEVAAWLVQFSTAQAGVAHPIGDRYAVSLIPTVLAVASASREAAEALLRRTAVWLCDAHEHGEFGLGGVEAEPAEEIGRLLGGPFESAEYTRRRASLIATTVLDLCSVLGLSGLYEDIWNDLAAVEILPWILRMDDDSDQYSRTGSGNAFDPNVDFVEALGDDQEVAPHHADLVGVRLCELGWDWELMAVSAALRDRYFLTAIRSFA